MRGPQHWQNHPSIDLETRKGIINLRLGIDLELVISTLYNKDTRQIPQKVPDKCTKKYQTNVIKITTQIQINLRLGTNLELVTSTLWGAALPAAIRPSLIYYKYNTKNYKYQYWTCKTNTTESIGHI